MLLRGDHLGKENPVSIMLARRVSIYRSQTHLGGVTGSRSLGVEFVVTGSNSISKFALRFGRPKSECSTRASGSLSERGFLGLLPEKP